MPVLRSRSYQSIEENEGTFMAHHDHHWAFRPVDPFALFGKLRAALGLGSEDGVTYHDIVKAEMPKVDSTSFREEYLLKEVLRKYPDFDQKVDTRLAALEAFLADEAVNSETNDRLLSIPTEGDVAQVLQLARRKIAEILGRFDEKEFWNSWRFGPHSTLSVGRHDANPANKMCIERPTVPARAWGLAAELLSMHPLWATAQGGITEVIKCVDLRSALTVCEWDLWTSVRKNAETDRGIGIPTDMGVVLQLAIGRMMRKRLYAAGINLNDQSFNQRAACIGSRDGSRTTVDVKSASQSVTTGLVYNLIGSQSHRDLDPRWYLAMDATRAPYTKIDEKQHKGLHPNELFSAMGNGYTFELESMIFYALAWACCSYLAVDTDVVSVYGDDIILPGDSRVSDLFQRAFSWCGFRINADKSFGLNSEADAHGNRFRESCGKHFLNGRDVTPFYVDGPLTQPQNVVLCYNNLIRWAREGVFSRDGRVLEVAVWLLGHLGDGYRNCRIPYGEENDGCIADWDEAVATLRPVKTLHVMDPKDPKSVVKRMGLSGFSCNTFEVTPRSVQFRDFARYLLYMYNSKPGSSGWAPPRRKPNIGEPLNEDTVYKTAALIPLSKGLKTNLQARHRTVRNWALLGPWVRHDGSTDKWEFFSRNLFTEAAKLWRMRDPTKEDLFPPLSKRRAPSKKGKEKRVK
jgi:hypothetical protein